MSEPKTITLKMRDGISCRRRVLPGPVAGDGDAPGDGGKPETCPTYLLKLVGQFERSSSPRPPYSDGTAVLSGSLNCDNVIDPCKGENGINSQTEPAGGIKCPDCGTVSLWSGCPQSVVERLRDAEEAKT